MSDGKDCFVIAPIGKPGSETRKKSDEVLEYIIKPAVEARGYKAIRADGITKPGIISTDMITMIIESPLVVANLTDHDPNVFYELALRHAIKKPVIQIIEQGQQLPFDVNQSRTIEYTTTLNGADKAKKLIISQLDAIEKNESDFDNPITTAMEIQSLRMSENPVAKSNAEILENITMLSHMVNSIRLEIQSIRYSLPEEERRSRFNLPEPNLERRDDEGIIQKRLDSDAVELLNDVYEANPLLTDEEIIETYMDLASRKSLNVAEVNRILRIVKHNNQ